MFFRGCCFSVNVVVGYVTLFGLMTLVDKLPGLSFSINVLLILPLLIASTIEGKAFARQTHSRPPAKSCWVASIKMMIIVSLLVLAVALVRIAFVPDSFAFLSVIDVRSLALTLGVCGLLGCLLIHGGYAFGLASELKGQQTSDQH